METLSGIHIFHIHLFVGSKGKLAGEGNFILPFQMDVTGKFSLNFVDSNQFRALLKFIVSIVITRVMSQTEAKVSQIDGKDAVRTESFCRQSQHGTLGLKPQD